MSHLGLATALAMGGPACGDTGSDETPVVKDMFPKPDGSSSASPSGSEEPVGPAGVGPDGELTDVQAGTPEILLDDLTFPGRFVLRGSEILLANRRDSLGTGENAEILAVSTAGGSPTQVLEHPSIEGFLLDGDRFWVNSFVTHSVEAFDRASGAGLGTVPFPEDVFPVQMAQTATDLFVTLVSSGTIQRVAKDFSSSEVIWPSQGAVSIQWLQLEEDVLYFVADSAAEAISSVSRVNVDGTAPASLVQRQSQLGGLVLVDDYVVFVDVGAGTIERVPRSGGASEVLASVAMAWAITADSRALYVSAQPDECEDETQVGTVYRVPLEGGTPEVLAPDQPCPSMLIAATDALYWVNNGYTIFDDSVGTRSLGGGQLVRLPR